MKWRALAGALLLTVVAPAAAWAAGPPPPRNDPFYQPPAGFATTAPGTVLRTRPVTASAFGSLPQDVDAWQILYRTTDSLGQPEATVTTLLEPTGAALGTARPLLSYQVAEDSPAPQCAMSYQLRLGSGNSNIVSQAEILLIDAALERGWAVTVPDYEGPASAFVAGPQAGQAVLDGIRATRSFTETPGPVGLWGYSGGALASGWAAELAPAYAPDLHIAGVAEGGLPVNPEHILTNINGGPFAGLAMSGIAGLSQAYPQLADFLRTYLTPAGKAAFARAATQCNGQNAGMFAFTDVFKFFTVPDPLSLPVPQQVLADVTMGQHTPAAPLYVYQSVNDELVVPADVDSAVSGYCARGASVTYQRDVLSEHVALAITGAPDALNWLSDRLSGVPAATGCRTSTVVTSLLSPGALPTLGAVLYGDLLALLGQPIGPGDIA